MHNWSRQQWKMLSLALISTFSYLWIGYFLERSNFYQLLLSFSIAFAAYYFFSKRAQLNNSSFYIGLGIVFRLLFLFSIPSLSDDYFRFIWDGQLMANGLNPFDFKPSEVQLNFPNKELLLTGMNSPNYYTVYPPLAQLVYWLSAKISPNSILGSIITLRSILLLAEVGVVILLPRLLSLLKINPINAVWYILNPLVIVEISGNLHFEGVVIFFLLLAVYMLAINKSKLASLAWALAAATKLIPLLLLPIFLRKLRGKKAIYFFGGVALLFLLLWWPFYSPHFLENFLASIQLYSSSFEFNASVYYLVREVGFVFTDYNIIQTAGPILTVLAYLGMLFILLQRKIITWPSFFRLVLFALSWYYLLALIIHPWYSITLVFLAVFTRFKYPMLWSFLAVLSYCAYNNANFQENYWLIALEYTLVVGFACFELFNLKKLNVFS